MTWCATVPVGWALILLAVHHVVTVGAVEQPAAFVMTAGLLVLLELLPLVAGRGHDPQGVVMSTAFLMALLFLWGVWPAMLGVGIASLAADLRARKQWWKVLFNPAQYAVSVGAAYLVILAVHGSVGLDHALPRLSPDALLWIPLAWVVYYLVNMVVVSCVLTYTGPLRALLLDDVVHTTLMTFAVMAVSPIVVVVALHSWFVMPLLLIPLLLLYYTASMSLEREHAAGHDDLTGLPNRKTLRFELDEALETYEREGTPFGLMLIDMNDFKRVNDTLGHQVGDRLLIEFAARLRERVRPGDFVARLGGDEFAIIVHDTDEAAGRAIAQRVCTSISHSIDVGALALETEASVGIAMCPDHGTDGGTLLRRADVAMYTAKAARTGVEVYSPARDTNSADALGLLSELRQALADDELELHYQPKVDTADGTPIGVEALVRWRHPVRGFVPPDEFIPLAEGSGIMPRLTERVVDLALAQIARWRDEGMSVPVAVNISPTDLTGSELPCVVARGLRAHDLPPGMLQLEITERIVTHAVDDAKRNLAELRGLGVSISLDDFGTGYSSLLRLSSMPVDEIKIDRGFISAMSEGERAVGIVRALVDLAHTLGMPSIAEGVETAEELAMLETLGCDGVQGWHIARPMPAEQVTAWLHERVPAGPALPELRAV
ncbi:putative bifunctional diguanylate cyclase/phosphodiesterase [Lapillicoccus jejuensis]|nr:EAL domain-containing protein [Lapillicoccus jejuensis]